MNDFEKACRMDDEFSKWFVAYNNQYPWHKEKYEIARAAFEGGYKLATSNLSKIIEKVFDGTSPKELSGDKK